MHVLKATPQRVGLKDRSEFRCAGEVRADDLRAVCRFFNYAVPVDELPGPERPTEQRLIVCPEFTGMIGCESARQQPDPFHVRDVPFATVNRFCSCRTWRLQRLRFIQDHQVEFFARDRGGERVAGDDNVAGEISRIGGAADGLDRPIGLLARQKFTHPRRARDGRGDHQDVAGVDTIRCNDCLDGFAQAHFVAQPRHAAGCHVIDADELERVEVHQRGSISVPPQSMHATL